MNGLELKPRFQAFLDLKKHVALKLGISNGPKAAKVTGAVQKEIKEKHPNLNTVKIVEEGRKHFDKNINLELYISELGINNGS